MSKVRVKSWTFKQLILYRDNFISRKFNCTYYKQHRLQKKNSLKIRGVRLWSLYSCIQVPLYLNKLRSTELFISLLELHVSIYSDTNSQRLGLILVVECLLFLVMQRKLILMIKCLKLQVSCFSQKLMLNRNNYSI